jgi:hypothetical protein
VGLKEWRISVSERLLAATTSRKPIALTRALPLRQCLRASAEMIELGKLASGS